MNNRELIQKADLALSDLTSNGGILPAEEALSFVKKVTLAPTILNAARKIGMKSHTKKVNKIGFGSRILRKATSGTALTRKPLRVIKPDSSERISRSSSTIRRCGVRATDAGSCPAKAG